MTLVLTRSDVKRLLDYDSCIDAVEAAFRSSAVIPASVMGTHVDGGGFHVKAAGLDRVYAVKTNANFPGNPSARGLPTIQGVLSLHDAVDGRLLALMDSIEITSIRTAAATAVAARHLARKDSKTVTIIGCGIQGRSQLRALRRVRPIERVFAFDVNQSLARSYADEMTADDVEVVAIEDFHDRLDVSDIVITCTPSRAAFLYKADISPGTFVGAVGADSDTKQELSPDLLASSKLVVDVLEQCATIGDLHHALEAGVMRREDVHADLAQILNGDASGRTSDDEIIVFDSTGTALEDVAAAIVVYERAKSQKAGIEVMLGD